MKRWLILTVLVAAAVSTASAGGFRLGAQLGAEFVNRPSLEDVSQEFDQRVNLVPGLYWEVVPGKLGFGMTYLLNLDKVAAPAPVNQELFLNWISSLDLRFHLFGPKAFLDPYLEAGLGAAGRSNVTNYEAAGAGTNDYSPTNLSLFGQLGGGLGLTLGILQLGARADWRFWNGLIPGTTFDPYPLKNFSVALVGGLAF